MREETCCCHYMGNSFGLAARDLLYSPSQESTYHGHCYTSCGAPAGTRKFNGSTRWDRSSNLPHNDQIRIPQTFMSPNDDLSLMIRVSTELLEERCCLHLYTKYYFFSLTHGGGHNPKTSVPTNWDAHSPMDKTFK